MSISETKQEATEEVPETLQSETEDNVSSAITTSVHNKQTQQQQPADKDLI